MNITFLIGNGFDLNLGMKTRYSDFYEYYKTTPSENEDINTLKKGLDSNYKYWSDLEVALGEYTKQVETVEQFNVILSDIRKHLAIYIGSEEDKYLYSYSNILILQKSLMNPENHLIRVDKESLLEYRKRWTNSTWRINIVSFNYSASLEELLKFSNTQMSLPSRRTPLGTMETILQSIRHIHGYTNKDMVLGVNDASQIHNDDFKTNPYFLDALVKPDCNKSIGHLMENDCRNIINNSNLACLFGLSLGETDKMWWEILGERLRDNDFRLIIFEHGDEIDAIDSYRQRQERDNAKNKFLSKTNLTLEEQKDVKSKIKVGFNTDIFKIKLQKVDNESKS